MHVFDNDIHLIELRPKKYKGTISQNWLVGEIPNGGYLIALLGNAMAMHSDKKTTPIVTANYISRCKPGDCEIHVECFAQSAQFNRYQAILYQEGKEKIRCWGTFANEKIECDIDKYETPVPQVAELQECVAIPEVPNFTLSSYVDIRLDPYSAGWMQGKLRDESIQKGWISFRQEREYDIPALLLMSDVIPPAVFVSLGLVAWVPTIELTINIRNMPQSKWLRFYTRTRFITCGMLETDGEMWDDNRLVSISRQIAQVRIQK
ncbi:MAG: thioesterase family protein [Spirochaetota bacterium]|nr:thioesterase family protein [Spirochaetota bacterium]